jgi:hypothetical protein
MSKTMESLIAEVCDWAKNQIEDFDLFGRDLVEDIVRNHDWSRSNTIEIPARYTISGNPETGYFDPPDFLD